MENPKTTGRGASDSRSPSLERRLFALASRQHGLATRSQLLRIGMSESAIDRRLEGRFTVVHAGVYQVGPIAADHAPEMAAVLACGRRAVVSHVSAAALWDLVTRPAVGSAIHVTIVGSECRRVGIRAHRVAALPREDETIWRGIPLTTPARTLLDLAGQLEEYALERAVARAERTGLTSMKRLLALLSKHPNRRGVRTLRGLVDQGSSLTRSEAEEQLRSLIARARLPTPRFNARACGFEVDVLWPNHRLVAEVDGFAFHRSRASFESDRGRDAALVSAGFAVLRVTWRQLEREPEVVVAQVAAALARAVSRATSAGTEAPAPTR